MRRRSLLVDDRHEVLRLLATVVQTVDDDNGAPPQNHVAVYGERHVRVAILAQEGNVVVSFSSSHDDGDGAALYSGTMNIVTTPSAFGSGTLRGSVLRGLGAAAAATTTTAAAALL